ncbi:MAG: GNAT family N-acetyltransferase [Synergistaceae bacterium]|nr:GNAT family N-acetyltransferase [Synergistaceae bacterium]
MSVPDLEARIAVRFMREDDWKIVSEIYREGIDSGIATFERSVPPYGRWDTTHLKNCRLVSAIAGVVMGWAALSPASIQWAYRGVAETSIYVSAQYQGRGIGKLLLTFLTRQSELNRIWTLQSGIIEGNDACVALHESCGFRHVGIRERIAQDRDGEWRSVVLMERRSDWK